MSELIPITTDSEGIQAVKGRDLHAFLESKEPYTRWLSRHIEKYGFIAGQDFMTEMSESTGGRPQQDYELARFACYQLAFQTRVEDQFVSTAKMIGVGKASDRISRYGQGQSSGRVGASFPRNGGVPRGARQADSASVVLGCFCHVGGEDYRRVCSHCGENKEPVHYVNIDKMPTPVYGGGNNQIKSPRVAATTGSMDTQNGAVHHG